MHPYGTGSERSEFSAGCLKQHAKNRAGMIQSVFRRTALWAFWMLDRIIKNDLFNTNRRRCARGRQAPAQDDADGFSRTFGTAVPQHIPESTAWWRAQAKDLFALTEESEMGMMQAMVTITHNDSVPELLSVIRRGPFAEPTEAERVEYLLTRVRTDRKKPDFENYAFEHVLSYQRRIAATKDAFFTRNKLTPLGIVQDWWDRTEAQMRAALHAHILVWFRPRKMPENYKPVPPVPRTVPGTGSRQRPIDQKVEPLAGAQHDHVYQCAHVGPIVAELVRPDVSCEDWGGYDLERLRIAGLARAIQMRLPYLHSCTSLYCLKDRSTCRFFFPWPEQPHQTFDENTERSALQRRLPEDDQFCVPHNLYLTVFSPSSVNCMPFDPQRGADHARSYATKYASKPEKWYVMETTKNDLKDWLKCRTVGLCMVFNRLLNFHVVRSTRPCQFTPACFIGKKEYRNLRDPGHVAKVPDYPDPKYYLTYTQKYFFRHASLRHLRVEQFTRYLAMAGEQDAGGSTTAEDTVEDDEAAPIDTAHRNYDEQMEATPQGAHFLANVKHVPGCRRRVQTRLGCSRVPFIEPIGASREDFYESKLVFGLPWYCPELPQVVVDEQGQQCTEYTFQWDPPCDEIGGRRIDSEVLKLGRTHVSFEVLCNRLETTFCDAELGVVCRCCNEEMEGSPCPSCRYATGFHICLNEHNNCGHHLWRKGSLHAGVLDVQRVLFNLHRKLLPLDALKSKAQGYVDANLITSELAERCIRVIESERGDEMYVNDLQGEAPAESTTTGLSTKLSPEQLDTLLTKREAMMRDGAVEGGVTDQWKPGRDIQHLLPVAAGVNNHAFMPGLPCVWVGGWGGRCRVPVPQESL